MALENDFLPFAVGSSANVESQTTYAEDPILSTGFQNGIANPQQVNKVLRQSSIMAAVIAQFIVDYAQQAAIDNGTIWALEANLAAGIKTLISEALAVALGSGGTIYTPQFASVIAGALDASGAGGQLRLTYGNYGVILRNDGSNLYLVLTPSGQALSGGSNSLRPLVINLATGAVSLDGTGAGVTCGGQINAASAVISGGETVGGALTAGSLNVTGAATVNGAFQAKGGSTVTGNESVSGTVSAGSLSVSGSASVGGTVSANTFSGSTLTTNALTALYQANLAGGAVVPAPPASDNSTLVPNTNWVRNGFPYYGVSGGGWQKLITGMIIQWGVANVAQGVATLSFPIAFPNAVMITLASKGYLLNNPDYACGMDALNNSQFYLTNSSGATGIRWIALGY
jgi:hypothetical protein